MTTATKSKTKAANWVEWNDKLKAKREELAAITGLGDAQEQHRRARQGLIHTIGRANQSRYTPGGGIIHAGQPAPRNPYELTGQARQTDDGILEVAAALLTYLDGLDEKMDAGARQADPQKALFVSETRTALRERRDALEDARHQAGTLQAEKDRVAGELAALEEQAPKASASTLGAMAKECEQAAKERDRIAARLKELEADDGTLEKAKQQADTAREQLEEAEAMAALGETDPEAVKASKAAADKGQKALEEAEADYRQQEAARRGLARKLEEATTYHDTLANTYNQAVIRIRGVDLATREAALVEHAKAFQEHLADLARIYADLEEAQPQASYGQARLEIQMPTLHHHPDADEINSDGFIMTPNGREE
ncbi:hypothetical protein [Halomonas ramblicola]|uniref:hypothetical protein n=1 Tax=Halomonas ramblicola TaxID=747349 RepID=UPI0025B5EF5D|nr:hypothetical protein [Halomonas ramblicola]MDN3521512.1 hypothetical protein [Halomonas ramblicola]